MKLSDFSVNVLCALVASFLFMPFLGSVHLFDWDEINFAECAREMIVSNDYSTVKINYQPFWEKPPLFIWMQVLSMKLFGINEFAARFPNALCGVITLIVLLNIGKKLYAIEFGLLWALVYTASFLPHFYFKSGIIDPWFNLFIFSGIYFFILFIYQKRRIALDTNLILSAFFIGLGTLTKGPVAILIFSLCIAVYWGIKKFVPIISFLEIVTFIIVLFLTGGSWFLYELLNGRADILVEFFNYQIRLFKTPDSGHGGPFIYHFIVLLIGCFPASIIAIKAFQKSNSDTIFQKEFKWWVTVLLCLVLAIFSIVKTKIIHYSSLCYFPLTFLATYAVYKIINYEMGWKKWMTASLLIIGLIWGVLITLLPWIGSLKDKDILAALIHDKFALANFQAKVIWSTFDFIIGPAFLVILCVILATFKRRSIYKSIIALFILCLLFINACSISITPKIEQYTQGAAIEFYEYLSKQDCYIETIGYKSYAHLFYSQKQPQTHINHYNMNWLLNEKIDKPAYFVSKINDAEVNKERYPNIIEIYRKNGFVFYRRRL